MHENNKQTAQNIVEQADDLISMMDGKIDRLDHPIRYLVLDWWGHPAKWYQFWYPMSGLIGGVIFGFISLFFIFWAIS